MKLSELDWEELHTLLVFIRTRSIETTAGELRTRPTTIARRLERLEKALGLAIVDRRGRKSQPDTAFDAAAARLLRLESLITDTFEKLIEQLRADKIRVRVTTAPAISQFLVAPAAARLLKELPNVELVTTSETAMLSLANRQADFALRMGKVADPLLIGKRVGEFGYGLYGSRAHWTGSKMKDLDRMDFDLVSETNPELTISRWIVQRFPTKTIRARFDLSASIAACLAESRFLGVIPCALGDQRKDLVRVAGPDQVFSQPIYLLAHRNFRRHPQKVAVYRELSRLFEQNAAALRG